MQDEKFGGDASTQVFWQFQPGREDRAPTNGLEVSYPAS